MQQKTKRTQNKKMHTLSRAGGYFSRDDFLLKKS